MSRKLFLSLLITVCAFLGILDAGYITYEKFSGKIPLCTGAFKCGDVLNSPWASVGPIPLSLLGLLFYSTMFALGFLAYVEITTLHIGKRTLSLPHLLLGLGAFGMGFSLYLVFIMGAVLQAWCLYCLFSAFNCLLIFLLSFLFFQQSRKEKV